METIMGILSDNRVWIMLVLLGFSGFALGYTIADLFDDKEDEL